MSGFTGVLLAASPTIRITVGGPISTTTNGYGYSTSDLNGGGGVIGSIVGGTFKGVQIKAVLTSSTNQSGVVLAGNLGSSFFTTAYLQTSTGTLITLSSSSASYLYDGATNSSQWVWTTSPKPWDSSNVGQSFTVVLT